MLLLFLRKTPYITTKNFKKSKTLTVMFSLIKLFCAITIKQNNIQSVKGRGIKILQAAYFQGHQIWESAVNFYLDIHCNTHSCIIFSLSHSLLHLPSADFCLWILASSIRSLSALQASSSFLRPLPLPPPRLPLSDLYSLPSWNKCSTN